MQADSIVYAAKNVVHRFHPIEEELTVTVFFAPAEYPKGNNLTAKNAKIAKI